MEVVVRNKDGLLSSPVVLSLVITGEKKQDRKKKFSSLASD